MGAVGDGVVVVGCGEVDDGDDAGVEVVGVEVVGVEVVGAEVVGVEIGDVALLVAVWLLPHALTAMAAAMATVAAR